MAIASRKFIKEPQASNFTRKLRWWSVSQNNSGGHFYNDDNVAEYVLVQAYSTSEAEAKLRELTEDSSHDWCECCGERWYISLWDDEGTEEPTIYERPLEEQTSGWFEAEARLHYHDGSVEAITFTKE